MYVTSKEQIAAAEKFIKSLPDSIVKGNYERWLEAVKLKGGITTESLEKFVALSNSLTKEFQNFPQEFSMNVKNSVNPGGGEFVAAPVSQTTEPVREGAKLTSDKKTETKVAQPINTKGKVK